MTDLPPSLRSVPARLGAAMTSTALPADPHDPAAGLHGTLVPRPETCVHGVVRPSVVAFLVDMVAGILVDTDPDAWTFTSDLSLRLAPIPAPAVLHCTSTVLRRGNRGLTTASVLADDTGVSLGYCLAGFARLPRREGDPCKPPLDWSVLTEARFLDRPLADAAGIVVEDASRGIVTCDIVDDLRNPAGALQGAIVALVGELAVEVAAGRATGSTPVVTDLDVRYLAQARVGPVTSRATAIGPTGDGSWHVELLDEGGHGRLVASILARARSAPAGDATSGELTAGG
ncbi:MAG: PaaI family thioesterase [Acidimicrobiales bacterium]|jgi:acyl-coenzyme A thioesterase PaaI-like protein|nr:PaaI family thioesterase [Acidimicrobiales bacterium]